MRSTFLRIALYVFLALFFPECSDTRKIARNLAAPVIKVEQPHDMVTISWTTTDEQTTRWRLYYQYGKDWSDTTLEGNTRSIQLYPHDGKNKLRTIAMTAMDHRGRETARNEINLDIVAIIPRSGWQANTAKPYKQQGVPVRITVHHEGGRVLADTADAARRIKNVQVWGMGKDRNWTDIPYHFLIGADGTVYEGRDINTVGETATEYDPAGHLLICFLGNYDQQELNPQLLNTLTNLIAYFCRKYNISPETIATHRDHSKQTTCPGKNIYPYFENGEVKRRVIELLQGK